MAAAKIEADMCVTSPPYWGQRVYGTGPAPDPRAIGLEPTLQLYLANIVHCMDMVWDVLAPTGTLWLNIGDTSVSTGGSGFQGKHGDRATRTHSQRKLLEHKRLRVQLAPKNIMGIPWRIAFAMQDSGWILRSEIIWEKPNCMPESAKDRPTNSFERIFLFAKQRHYFYDAEAVKEKASENTHARMAQDVESQQGSLRANGGTGARGIDDARPFKAGGRKKVAGWKEGPGSHSTTEHARRSKDSATKFDRTKANDSFQDAISPQVYDMRNQRNIWRFPTEAYRGDHFATFPKELPRRCILAGSRPGGVVFDPFMGTGTTAQVATELGRQFIGCELYQEYEDQRHVHRQSTMGLAL
ncbi:MAG TPA: site-specific DNA-methyltransferase [Steroidobacteraceae bacterium]|nr:site-specific DNA-methyltransferase [Steroidobacteraceae bacterium]